jgi:hypothetical protein
MRYGDIVLFGSYDEVIDNMKSIRALMLSVMKQIKTELKRDNRRIILENLLQSSIHNLDTLIHLKPGQNTIFAWATRNLYELNLITRFVLESEDQMNQWMAQIAQDEIEVWEGAITLADKEKYGNEIDNINKHINGIKKTVEKHGLKLTKFPATFQLAKNLKLADEHAGFYKIYSKFVHPSSILVNKPENINLEVIFSLLTMNAQKYGLDTLNRISEANGIPVPKRPAE